VAVCGLLLIFSGFDIRAESCNTKQGAAMDSGFVTKAEERQTVEKWIAGLGNPGKAGIGVVSWQQGWGKLGFSKSIINQPLNVGGKEYAWGLGTHADSEIVLRSTKPIKTFCAWAGVDCNKDSKDKSTASMVFSVWADGKMLAESRPLTIKSSPERIEVQLNGATEFTLKVKAQNTIHLAHADWVEAEIVTTDGETLKLGTPETKLVSKALPISFKYNGMDSEAWFSKWGIVHTQTDGKEFTTHKYICTDKDTGLECTFELQDYKNFPACLWNVYFKNNGKAATPILEQVKTLDLSWAAPEQKELYRAHGAFNYEDEVISGEAFRDDFMLVRDNLARNPEIALNAVGGRPSVDWMPYFNFAGKNEGLIFGIGWTGQWQAKVKASGESVRFQAGMENIHTVLNPGESIRQPAILMIYWQGDDPIRGHNLLRRFMTDEILPHYDGKSVQAPVTYGSWGGMSTAEHLKRIANIKEQKLPYDYYWIDADWYGPDEAVDPDVFTSKWGEHVGMWKCNAVIHPQGLKPISDAAHQAGMKFLLWFEPERGVQGTPLTLEHPDWFLGDKIEGGNLLLNLGNPEARKGITDLIAGIIQKEGIDCYRQDFNFGPLPYWQANDTPNRVGMTEIRHVEGLYAFWDELRRRFPNLMIDNCAGGGRRLDFEMMRRSIPLWASDMQCFPDFISERNQQQVAGLSMWIPQFTFGTEVKHAGDTYHFRSTMAGGIVAHLFPSVTVPIDPKYPYQWLRDRLDEYHRAKIYFSGDFYPLMPQSDSFRDWSAYQFHRADLNSGIVEVFRKKDSPIEKICFELRGLDPSATYEVENADTKAIVKISGRDLMEKGWPVEISQKRDSRLFFYHAVSTKK
jgi:alpha-galactosidase